MTITIPPELAKRFEELARLRGTTPEAEAVQQIESKQEVVQATKLTREERAAILAKIAKPSDHLIPLSALTREELYD